MLSPSENARRIQQPGRDPHLFRPISFRGVTAKNRIMLSPLCEYSSDDGMPNDWHLVHLGARAAGGAGIVCTEATHVSAEGRITAHCLGLWNEAQRDGLARIAGVHRGAGRGAGNAARPCRAQGVDPSPLGGQHAAIGGRWRLAGDRAFRPALWAGPPHPARHDTGRHRPGDRRIRHLGAAGTAGRLSHHRAACRAWLPAAPVPQPAEQPAERRPWRRHRGAGAAAAGDHRRGADGVAGRPAALRPPLLHRLGAGRARPGRGHRHHPAARRHRPGRSDRLHHRRGGPPAEADPGPRLPSCRSARRSGARPAWRRGRWA